MAALAATRLFPLFKRLTEPWRKKPAESLQNFGGTGNLNAKSRLESHCMNAFIIYIVAVNFNNN